jgi:hypothetical protein
MGEADQLVAVISPWERISEVVKHKFRMESLPAEKKVMVWREDLQSEQQLIDDLSKIGIKVVEVRRKRPTDWKAAD